MPRKKPNLKPPFLRRGARAPKQPSRMGQFENWLRRYPALRIACVEARRRFNDTEGVCGFGVGRKFCESTGQYGAAPESTGGLCIKVFVRRKKKTVAWKDHIPAWIDVSTKGTARKTRVLLDVVSIGGKGRRLPVGILQQSRDWPEAGRIICIFI